MKKVLALLLVLVMCLSLAACGKSKAVKAAEEAIDAIGEVTINSGDAIKNAEKLYGILTDAERQKVDNRLTLVEAQESFEALQEKLVYDNAKEAYGLLNEVAKLCEEGMDAIYGAWYFGIYKADDAYSVYSTMASEVPGFSSDELEAAATALGYTESLIKYDWQYSLWTVEYAITVRGDYDVITENMSEAQSVLQALTEQYDDYTYYPKLKEYYASINSYVDFFKNPTGSFNQLADTINNYENGIRTLKSDVGFLF